MAYRSFVTALLALFATLKMAPPDPRSRIEGTYDPELPIRGRYLSERLQSPVEGFTYEAPQNRNVSDWFANRRWAYLGVRDGRLIGKARGEGPGGWVYLHRKPDGSVVAFSEEPVLVFIPEKAVVPELKRGGDLGGGNDSEKRTATADSHGVEESRSADAARAEVKKTIRD